MNVYDFDRTIYKKDSSVELYKYICRKKPWIFFRCIGKQLFMMGKYKLHLISKEQMKEAYFSFLKYVNGMDEVNKFVNQEIDNINKWYLLQKKNDDVIVSASPEFLVRVFAEKLGLSFVIASEVDIETGMFHGKNCYGQEKVNRFKEEFPTHIVEKFYSDSKSDIYMAQMAQKPYFVNRNKISEWKF